MMRYSEIRDKVNHSGRLSRMMLLCIAVMFSCLEPYDPPVTDNAVDILVVDGFLDSSDSTVIVKLSKANAFGGDTATIFVNAAAVSVEDEKGSRYVMSQYSAGSYTGKVQVDRGLKYRLLINVDGKDYASAFEGIKQTPPIDNVLWNAGKDGVTIVVNTHDPSGTTRFYKWDYIETYEYDAAKYSSYKVVNRQPVPRLPADAMFTCWKTTVSTRILVNSTEQLRTDIVNDFPVMFIPVGSLKLSKRYSLLVKQRALSETEYNFLRQLEQTTESIGTLFDPQPGQVSGNIEGITSGAKAIGYFSAGNSVRTRFFMTFADLPERLRRIDRPFCPTDTVCVVPQLFSCVKEATQLEDTDILEAPIYAGPSIVGYTLTYINCADCRTMGGVLERPAFWP